MAESSSLVLRTNRSPPVALHPASRRRSYHWLRDARASRQGLPPCRIDAITGALKAGIPAGEALRIATWNGAKYTRTLDRLGSITPGKLADLILVEGDPLNDISAIRKINLVMKEGAVYYPAEIHAATGIKPFAAPLRPAAVKP